MIPFITSKTGKLNSIPVFKYSFSEDLNTHPEQKEKFIRWLKYSKDIFLLEMSEINFTCLNKLDQDNWQYNFEKSKEIFVPFSNTQQISFFIGSLVRKSFSEIYERFLNNNIFITDKIEIQPFILNKCFGFNVEVFTNGDFLIHFSSISKITSPNNISIDYIKKLKTNLPNHTNNLIFSIIESKKFRRLKINIFDNTDIKKSGDFIKENQDCFYNQDCFATFDYHFISFYSPSIFNQINKNTQKDISETALYLKEIVEKIKLPDCFHLNQKPFHRIQINRIGKNRNLIVGGNKNCSEQSCAFYNGIFKPVSNKIIQPVKIDGINIESFYDKLQKFNNGGKNLKILNSLELLSNENIDISIIQDLKRKYGEEILFSIFTKYEQPSDFFKPFKENTIKFQSYLGNIDEFKLSNFTVKCLEKLGGILDIIKDTYEPETTYFIGIDLGHTTYRENEKFSNLGIVFFNNKGELIYRFVNKKIPRNEAVTSETLWISFHGFSKFLKYNHFPMPKKLIFHRDGKIHDDDIASICKQAKKHLRVENIDIVEIVKSGFPIIAGYDEQEYTNLNSGDFWICDNHNYAILVTNTQINKGSKIVNPIIIKRKYGNTDFKKIVWQVYWFTRIYTSNLYYPTRLPATTKKANDIAGTSKIIHEATYKG